MFQAALLSIVNMQAFITAANRRWRRKNRVHTAFLRCFGVFGRYFGPILGYF
jgi:hypothetical protein